MAMKWSGADLELLLGAGPGPRGERGRRLQNGLRDAVRSGRLGAGESLPGSRELAATLGIARGTIVEAYEQLVAEGYLEARTGSGTVIGTRAGHGLLDAADPPPPAPRPSIDMRPGVPDLREFPADDWAWALGRAARSIGGSQLDYGDALGHPVARQSLASALRRTRAAETTAHNVVLGTGFAQCLSLILGALADDGVTTLAVEDPGDRSVDAPARAAGIRIIGIPVDVDGIDVDALTGSPARAVLVTPSHQSPTGAVLSGARRMQLIEWAERTGGWIIEDDYDSEFRYDRRPVGALQGLAPERVALIGSASKTHAPALRLGWMAVPAGLLASVADRKRHTDRGSPVLDQVAFALMLDTGRHDRHVRAMRAVYRQRRDAVIGALGRHAPGAELTGLAAGFHGVLRLPAGRDESATVTAAAGRGVALRGLSAFSIGDPPHPSLVLGYGNADEEQLAAGVLLIADLIG